MFGVGRRWTRWQTPQVQRDSASSIPVSRESSWRAPTVPGRRLPRSPTMGASTSSGRPSWAQSRVTRCHSSRQKSSLRSFGMPQRPVWNIRLVIPRFDQKPLILAGEVPSFRSTIASGGTLAPGR